MPAAAAGDAGAGQSCGAGGISGGADGAAAVAAALAWSCSDLVRLPLPGGSGGGTLAPLA